jgi:ketosteroid isomerase-like protein
MTPIEMFHRMHELVRDYDIRVVECFAPDGVLELPFAPAPLERRYVGRDAIRALLAPRYEAMRAAGRGIPSYDKLIIHETRDPQVIVAEFEAHTPSAPGRALAFAQVFRVADGQIVLQRDYFDSYAMAERLRVS